MSVEGFQDLESTKHTNLLFFDCLLFTGIFSWFDLPFAPKDCPKHLRFMTLLGRHDLTSEKELQAHKDCLFEVQNPKYTYRDIIQFTPSRILIK